MASLLTLGCYLPLNNSKFKAEQWSIEKVLQAKADLLIVFSIASLVH